MRSERTGTQTATPGQTSSTEEPPRKRNSILPDLNQLDTIEYPIQTYGIVAPTTMRLRPHGGRNLVEACSLGQDDAPTRAEAEPGWHMDTMGLGGNPCGIQRDCSYIGDIGFNTGS